MKYYILFCIYLVYMSFAVPVLDDSKALIEKYENKIDEKGNYDFSFRTSNGIQRTESGRLKNEGLPDEHLVVNGEYAYKDADGNYVVVKYYADETGFHILSPDELGVSIAAGVNPNVVASLLG